VASLTCSGFAETMVAYDNSWISRRLGFYSGASGTNDMFPTQSTEAVHNYVAEWRQTVHERKWLGCGTLEQRGQFFYSNPSHRGISTSDALWERWKIKESSNRATFGPINVKVLEPTRFRAFLQWTHRHQTRKELLVGFRGSTGCT